MQTTTIGWVAGAALLVGAVVRWMKSDMLTIALSNLGLPPIPKRFLPWIALVLGIMSGIFDVKLQSTTWAEAITKGLIAGVTAIAGHQVGIESLRRGKELLLLCLALAFGVAACDILTPKTVKDGVLTVSDLACIEEGPGAYETDIDALMVTCRILKSPITREILRNLVGQREAGRQAGFVWQPAGITITTADAGARDASRD